MHPSGNAMFVPSLCFSCTTTGFNDSAAPRICGWRSLDSSEVPTRVAQLDATDFASVGFT